MKNIYRNTIRFCIGIVMMLSIYSSKAQYVTIPDANLLAWFNTHGYANCINGNQLDTLCADTVVVHTDTLNLSDLGISDVTGIKYVRFYSGGLFAAIDLSHNNLTSIQPELAEKMQIYVTVILDYNHITTINLDTICHYGASPWVLTLEHNGLDSITDNTVGLNILQQLDLNYNNIDTIKRVYYNGLLSLRHNFLRHVPNINLIDCSIDVGANFIADTIRTVPYNGWLYCDSNFIPAVVIAGSGNYGTSLICSHNQINSITGIERLYSLDCSYNNITRLDSVQTLGHLYAQHNQLTSIGQLSTSLNYLDVSYNPLLGCIPNLPNVQYLYLYFDSTAIQCLPRRFPNTIYYGTPGINSVPTCSPYNNTYGCPQYSNLEGYSYFDTLPNCTFASTLPVLPYVKVQFWSNGNITQQCYTDWRGHYSFDEIDTGQYKLTIDTTGLAFTLNCPDSFNYTASVTSQELYQSGFNFGFVCKPGFDVGVSSISQNTLWFHPNLHTTINLAAGDMSAIYGLHCAAGTGGTVTLNFSGPITYLGPAGSALTPTAVTATSIAWNIPDYGLVDPFSAFTVVFVTDTTAPNHAPVCFTASVTPVTGDNNTRNNTSEMCSEVITAWDPNGKEVYPRGQISDSVQWLTYAIHFKNTGSAPATNILVLDTLDTHVDPTSFKLLAYDHANITQVLPGGIVQFGFPSINLPDSVANDSLSTGYVQYQVKLKPNLRGGTVINNSASIYFDYNAPMLTNTASDTIARNCTQTFDTIAHTLCQGDTFYVGPISHTQAGNFTDTLSSTGGCDSVVTLNLTIDNPLISAISVPQDTFCNRGSAVTISAQPTGGIFTGNGVTDSLFNPATATIGNDTISYAVTDGYGCVAITSKTVNVVYFSDSITAVDTVIFAGFNDGVYTFVTDTNISGSSYTWQYLNNADNLIHTASTLDTFDLVCWIPGERPIDTIGPILTLSIRAVVTAYGCSDTTQWITAQDCQVWGGAVHNIIEDSSVSVYPNPATDGTWIVEISPDLTGVTCQVMDVNGKMVYSTKLTVTKTKLNTNLAAGTYFMRLISGQNIYNIKLVRF